MKDNDQGRAARQLRLKKGRCPIHNKPMLQCDSWYQPRVGRRYTFVSCVHPQCEVEAFADFTFWTYRLTPKWSFLLEQNDQGSGEILHFPETQIQISEKLDNG